MITIVFCTIRKLPNFDWAADSLVHALARIYGPAPLPGGPPSVNGVELIVVDGRLDSNIDEERRAFLRDAIRDRFPFRHVAPKPTPWQGRYRKTKRDFYGLCNARNTGIALARGDHIVLFDDCSVLDEDFLFWHNQARLRGVCVAGSYRSYTEAKVENGRVIEGKLHPNGIDNRGVENGLDDAPSAGLPSIGLPSIGLPKRCNGSWMYGLNTSFPLSAALTVNGYDEKYDGQGGSEDCQFGLQIEKAGYQVIFFPGCIINQILSNHEPVCEYSSWGEPQPKKQKEIVLMDGRPHFANEWLIQEWFKNPQVRSQGNDFELKELRDRALATGEFPVERATTVDWRDKEPLEEME